MKHIRLFSIVLTTFLVASCSQTSSDTNQNRSAIDGVDGGAKVCALYYRAANSSTLLKGPASSEAAHTASLKACFDFVNQNYFPLPHCGQPAGTVFVSAMLIPPSKNVASSPVIDFGKEWAGSHNCSAVGESTEKVCVIYFSRKGDPTGKLIQGTFNNRNDAVSSFDACKAYMIENVFDKPNCSQPDGLTGLVFLINNSKHSYQLHPDINYTTDFVYGERCTEAQE